MSKTILRFLVIALIAVALGSLIYHISQPAGTTALRSGINNLGGLSRDLGEEHGFGERGFSLMGGLFGITGNLFLVAIVTVIVVSLQKLFAHRGEPVGTR